MNKRYFTKLVTEKTQLENRIDNLTIFLHSDAFQKLTQYEQNLLNHQRESMRAYLYYLEKRYDLYMRQREAIKNAENND